MKLIQLYLEALCYHLLSEGAGVSTEAPPGATTGGGKGEAAEIGTEQATGITK